MMTKLKNQMKLSSYTNTNHNIQIQIKQKIINIKLYIYELKFSLYDII